jgi:hypothetical protein
VPLLVRPGNAAPVAWSLPGLLDDRPANVLAAREVGMRGHVFTDVGTLLAVLEEEYTG